MNYYDLLFNLLYLIPLALALFVVWFFYPSIAGTRETKISRKEYVWFVICIVFIPLFGINLFLEGLFVGSWYACPQEMDFMGLLVIFLPWIVIMGVGIAYGVRTIRRLRRKSHTPDTGDDQEEISGVNGGVS